MEANRFRSNAWLRARQSQQQTSTGRVGETLERISEQVRLLENRAIYSPRNIRIVDGRILTSKALDAAEGEDGTVRKETLKRIMPIPPITLPNFCAAESFGIEAQRIRTSNPEAPKVGVRLEFVFHVCLSSCSIYQYGCKSAFCGPFEVESCYDSNKYPTMVAKLFR